MTEIEERFRKLEEGLSKPDHYARHPEFKPFNYNGTHEHPEEELPHVQSPKLHQSYGRGHHSPTDEVDQLE